MIMCGAECEDKSQTCNKGDCCRTLFLTMVITFLLALQFLQFFTATEAIAQTLSYNAFACWARADPGIFNPLMKSLSSRVKSFNTGEGRPSFVLSCIICLESIWIAVATATVFYKGLLIFGAILWCMYLLTVVDFSSFANILGKSGEAKLMTLQAQCVPHVHTVVHILKNFILACANQLAAIFMCVLDSEFLKTVDNFTLFSDSATDNVL